MNSEDTEWKPPRHKGRSASDSLKALTSLQAGEVKRIFHDDLKCTHGNNGSKGYRCSVSSALARLRKQGMVLESYHEAPHIVVIRRLK